MGAAAWLLRRRVLATVFVAALVGSGLAALPEVIAQERRKTARELPAQHHDL